MSFKKPDVKKPRLRLNENRKSLVSKEFFEYYKDKNPDTTIDSLKTFKNVLNTFHTELAKTISTTRDGFELPMIAYILVVSCERPKKENSISMFDFKQSSELGVGVKHVNFDTDTKLCKIMTTLSPIKYKFALSPLWSFKATKTFRKIVSDNYKKFYSLFYELPKNKKVSHLFKNI
jgi:hypothetical protein